MKRLLSELDNMRQVINIFPKKRRQKVERQQAVLSRTSELQDKFIDALGLKEEQKRTFRVRIAPVEHVGNTGDAEASRHN